MAFQSIPQSSLAGGFGRGVGQGLAEQLPKEVERIRLSQGLKNIRQDLGSLPFNEQLAELSGIPGMNIEKAAALMPYFQQMQSRKALAEKAKGISGEQKIVPESQQPSLVEGGGEAAPKRGSFRERMESQDFLVPKNEQQIYQRANELAPLYPNYNEQQLIEQAQAEDQRRIQSDTALQGKRDLIQKELQQAGDTWLQKSGNEKFRDIIGESQAQYLDDALRRSLDEGVSPYKAAKDAAKDMLDFAKTRQQVRTNRAAIFFSGKSGEKVLKDLQKDREEYAKRGQLENFRNDLINYHKLTPENADRLAFPESKNVVSFVDTLPKTKREKTRGMGQREFLTDNQIKEIADKMDKNDAPRTIALHLLKRGYDGNDFIERLKGYSKDFTERQKRDLTSLSDRYSLGDIQLFGLRGLPDVGAKR